MPFLSFHALFYLDPVCALQDETRFQIKNFSLFKDQKDYVGKSLDWVVAAFICKVCKPWFRVIFIPSI